MRRALIILGLGLVAIGILWPLLAQFPLGRLPGDLVFHVGRVRFYLPLTSSVLVSLVVTLVLRGWGR